MAGLPDQRRIPRAVAEHHSDGVVSEAYLRDIHAWLHADVDPDGPQQSTLRMIDELSARSSSPLKVSNLAETLGLSRPAMTLRLNRLVASFAGLWCPQRGENGHAIAGSQSKLDRIEEGRWVEGETIGFACTGSGNEIDLGALPITATADIGRTTPIESKWVDQGWRAEARTIEGKYNRGVVATKSILDLEHPSFAIPAPLVALLLG
jgi:uncharacterized protein